jgi:lipopolysaccharide export system protein LptA
MGRTVTGYSFVACWVLLLILPFRLFAQTTIEVINTDVLAFEEVDGKPVRKLLGNVQMRQDSLLMYCDSAYQYTDDNVIVAFSRVRAFLGDSVRMNCDKMNYDGKTRIAIATGKVVLAKNTLRLRTRELYYYRDSAIGRYTKPGEVSDDDYRLFSLTGTYFVRPELATFRGKVRLAHKDFDLAADTLVFQTKRREVKFVDTTLMFDRKCRELGTIHGNYLLPKKRGRIFDSSYYRDSTYTLSADTIQYDDSTGRGYARCSVHLTYDTATSVHGEFGRIWRYQRIAYVTESAFMIQRSADDTLILFADTLYTHEDTLAKRKWVQAYRHARFAMRELSGRADSLVYDMKDSLLVFYGKPVLFNPTYQVTGDTITMWQRKGKIDSLKVGPNAFTLGLEDTNTTYYNQSRSRMLYGKLKENRLTRLYFLSNCENIYWLKDQGKYKGMNRAFASAVTVHLKANKPARIIYLVKPDATFSPMHVVDGQLNQLDGFNNRMAERPERFIRYLPFPKAKSVLPEVAPKVQSD